MREIIEMSCYNQITHEGAVRKPTAPCILAIDCPHKGNLD